MKYVLALLSGFCLTLIVFASGVATAIVYLTAEPVPVRSGYTAASQSWTDKPVRVVAPNQDSLDGPAESDPGGSNRAAQAQAPSDIRETARDAVQAIDPITTAAASPEPAPRKAPELSAAHLEWCSEHYRSYDPSDNSYTAYSGAQRECVSPYSEGSGNSDPPEQLTSSVSSSAEGSSELTPSANLDPEHVQSCFARYRSYRPEDNTYQPYGGGPRRQCE